MGCSDMVYQKVFVMGFLCFFIMFFYAEGSAENYWGIYKKDKKDSFHLAAINEDTLEIEHSVDTGYQKKHLPLHGVSSKGTYVWWHNPGKRRKDPGEVIVYAADSLREISRFKVAAPQYPVVPAEGGGAKMGVFFKISDDESRFIAFTAENRENLIQIFDVSSGRLLLEQAIGRGKMIVQTSPDDSYLIAYGFKGGKRKIHVIDVDAAKLMRKHEVGRRQIYVRLDDSHYMVQLKLKQKAGYELLVRDYKSGNLVSNSIESSNPFIFYVNKNINYSLISYLDKEKKQKLRVIKINDDGQIENVFAVEEHMKPYFMKMSHDHNYLFVSRGTKAWLMNVGKPDSLVKSSVGFDINQGIFDANGEYVYFREGTGSEVAVVDVRTGEKINSSATGRKSVKFGKFLASVAMVAVGVHTGYFMVPIQNTDTAMILDQSEQSVFVINSKTNDVTRFNTRDLSEKKSTATGSGTFFVARSLSSDSIYVLSGSHVNLFDASSGDLLAKVDANIIGLDTERSMVFSAVEDGFEAVSLDTGEVVKRVESVVPDIIYALPSTD